MKFTTTLKQNYEFRRLYARGKNAAASCLVLYCRKNRANRSRLGFTVSKKVGCAVVRNRVRRRLREIYRFHEAELYPGYDLVVVARVKAAFSSYHELEKEFLYLAARLGLLKKEEEKGP